MSAEVAATQAASGECGGLADGWWSGPLRPASERAWILERVSAQLDLTLRAVRG